MNERSCLDPRAPGRHQTGVKQTVLRLALAGYILLLIGIILAADRGGGRFWHRLTDLPMGDKIGHCFLVGTLSLLLNLTLKGRSAPCPFSRIMLGSLLVAIAMTAEECSQAYFPFRTFDLFDGMANLAGVALGEVIARILMRRKNCRAIPAGADAGA